MTGLALNKRNCVFTVLSLVLMCVIFWFSSRDAVSSTEQSDFFITVFLRALFDGEIPHWLSVLVRKLAHFTVYAALGFCLYYSFEGVVKGNAKAFICSLFVSVLYAACDEIHQTFVPGRAGRLLDLLIDGCGAACGIGIAVCLLFAIRSVKRRSCR